MQFTHLVEICDAAIPAHALLTRAQLWRGLVLRVEAPGLFMPHLDDCQISAREASRFARRLVFGELVIDDLVTLAAPDRIVVSVPAQRDIAASLLTMTIEAPQEHALFVRFAYEDGVEVAADSVDAYYDKFRHSAYREADIDTIRLIRQMAQEGRLDNTLS